jgi:hypothetical protein
MYWDGTRELRNDGLANAAGLRAAERAMALADESITVLSMLTGGETVKG